MYVADMCWKLVRYVIIINKIRGIDDKVDPTEDSM